MAETKSFLAGQSGKSRAGKIGLSILPAGVANQNAELASSSLLVEPAIEKYYNWTSSGSTWIEIHSSFTIIYPGCQKRFQIRSRLTRFTVTDNSETSPSINIFANEKFPHFVTDSLDFHRFFSPPREETFGMKRGLISRTATGTRAYNTKGWSSTYHFNGGFAVLLVSRLALHSNCILPWERNCNLKLTH